MPTLAESLKAGVTYRANAFGDEVRRELAHVGSTGPGVTHALELFEHYASALPDEIEEAWSDAPTAPLKMASMRI